MTRLIPFAAALALLLTPAVHAANSADADKVLAQMDAASAKFKSAEASFKWDLYERVVRDTTSQTGTIYFQRTGPNTDMGAQILTPAKKTLAFNKGQFQLYDSTVDQLQTFSAGSNRGRYESFLTLGFGGSGKDLQKAWAVDYQGTETIDGVQTVKLDLIPKDADVKGMFTHITIWVDPTRAISLRQHAYTPSGDERTSYFTNIKYNQSIDTKKYAIKKTKNVINH